jgi:hypothetical protein
MLAIDSSTPQLLDRDAILTRQLVSIRFVIPTIMMIPRLAKRTNGNDSIDPVANFRRRRRRMTSVPAMQNVTMAVAAAVAMV